jgi:putative hemolysin
MIILLILLLLVLNALFVMSEIAIVSSRRVRLEQAAERGAKGAALALKLSNDPTRFLATIQIAITLIGIISGAVGEARIASQFREFFERFPVLAPFASGLATVCMVATIGYLSTVLGELVPKRLGLLNPERMARIVAAPMQVISRVATPVVWLLSASCNGILALFRLDAPDEVVSEEEIKGMIAKGTQAGVFHHQEQQIVERVFRFADLRVRALMVPRSEIDWIDANSTLSMVRTIVAASPHSHFLVCDGSLDKLVGVVHVKDVVKMGMFAGDDVKVAEITSKPLFVPDATKAVKILDSFRETGNHIAVVVDEFGGTEGLITLNDIVGAIVGEVAAGGIPAEAAAFQREDGSWLMDAAITIPEFKSILALQSEHFADYSSVNTLGGLVFAIFGRMPRTGERIAREGLEFEVVDMDARRVDKVLVRRLPPETNAAETSKDA